MAKFKVYYTIELNQVATDIFEANDFEVKLCSHNDEETYVKELAEFQPDAIMCRTEPITAAMMDTCTNLKVIGKQGAGLDNIDMDHAAAKGLQVVFAPAGNANAVAEHAVLLMLACAKRFNYVDKQFRGGNFLVRMNMENTYELGGKTLGMIGCGRISQLAMQKCKYGFGMKVIGYDPFLNEEKAAAISSTMQFTADLDVLYANSKYVTIHVPALPSTKGMVGADAFEKMQDGTVVLNFSRDVLVDDAAMAEALASGKVAKYVTDFANPAVMAMENTLVLPHLGASTEEAEDNCAKMAVAEIMDYLENGKKTHCVNMKD